VRFTAKGSVALAFSYRDEVATITVTDTGQGSKFPVRPMLPSVPDHAARSGRQAELEEKTRAAGYGGRRRTLMIVHDDLNHLTLFDSFLGDLGFNIVAAADTKIAGVMLNDISPDLFELDVDMPGKDGWSFAQ
jgi:PleD family two-component response regulator